MEKGLVSIIIGVHNEKEEHLRMAFNSLFNQSYQNIEIIVIDDDSDDNCKSVLNDICNGIKNITIVHNKTNLGLTKSLNIGLQMAKGEFIARMDADDYSTYNRIEKQVDYLKSHQDIDIIGTGVISFGDRNIFMSPAYGLSKDDADIMLFFSSTLCHPSVMIRKCFLERHHLSYDENVKKAQDYDLWERSSIYGKLAVTKDVLLYYRIHANQITSLKNKEQIKAADIIRKRRLSRIGINPTDKEYHYHELLSSGVDSSITTHEMEEWIKKLLEGNKEKNLVNGKRFQHDLRTRLLLFKLRNKKRINLAEIPLLAAIVYSRIGIKIKIIANKKIIKAMQHQSITK